MGQRSVDLREESTEQRKLAGLLAKYLDPESTFWTSLENKPLSHLSGLFQKRRESEVVSRTSWSSTSADRFSWKVARWRGDESAEIDACRTAAGRCDVMDGTKRARVMMALHLSGVFSAVNGSRHDCSRGRDRSRTRRDGCRRRPDVAGRRRAARQRWHNASVTPLSVPLRRVTRGRKHRCTAALTLVIRRRSRHGLLARTGCKCAENIFQGGSPKQATPLPRQNLPQHQKSFTPNFQGWGLDENLKSKSPPYRGAQPPPARHRNEKCF